MSETDWVLVPREPTKAMCDAAWQYSIGGRPPDPGYAYKAMLAAAPSAPQGGGVEAALRSARNTLVTVAEVLDSEMPHPILLADVQEEIEAIDAALTAQPRTDAAQQPPAEVQAQGGGEVRAWEAEEFRDE